MNHEEGVSTSHFDAGTITFDIFCPMEYLGADILDSWTIFMTLNLK